MPVYQFRCEVCDVFVDVSRSISEPLSPVECDICGSEMKRLYAIGGVEFKGNGWGKD